MKRYRVEHPAEGGDGARCRAEFDTLEEAQALYDSLGGKAVYGYVEAFGDYEIRCTPRSKYRGGWGLTYRIFNAGNVLGAIAFLAMIAIPGAMEGGMYITAIALTAVFGAGAYLSIRESGKKR